MATAQILEIIGGLCFILGSFFILSSAVGILRMPDFFTRLHPAGISDSIGLPLILLGIILQTSFGLITIKLLFIVVLSMVTSSTASHALSKSAWLSGLDPVGNIVDRHKQQKSPTKKKSTTPMTTSKGTKK